jgi:hypothetical protein
MVSILLIPEPNESVSGQEFRLRLERETQERWSKFYESVPDKDEPFPNGLSGHFSMVSDWLGRSACGRVLRLRLESDGRFLDATNADEAARLIGAGKTLGTLAAAFSD